MPGSSDDLTGEDQHDNVLEGVRRNETMSDYQRRIVDHELRATEWALKLIAVLFALLAVPLHRWLGGDYLRTLGALAPLFLVIFAALHPIFERYSRRLGQPDDDST